MKFLRTGKVKIANLRLPGDWRQRLASPHVRELANSVEELALLQRPAVRDGDAAIIWGRDRLAAMHLLGHEVVDVDVFQASDHEVQLAIIVENLRRRSDNRDKLLSDLAALYRAQEEAPPECQPDTDDDGVKQTPRGSVARAQAKAAAVAGTTPEAVKQAEKRERARLAENTPPPAEEPARPSWAPIAEAIDEIDRHLRAAKAGLTKMESAHLVSGSRFILHPLREALEMATRTLRGMRPDRACPYGTGADCAACHGSGWITADQAAQVPRESSDPGHGSSAPAAAGQKAGTTSRKRKQLDVRMPDGSAWGDGEGNA